MSIYPTPTRELKTGDLVKVTNTRRVGTSAYGNPTMRADLVTEHGDKFTVRTPTDADIAYGIGNREYRDAWHAVELSRAGRLVALSPVLESRPVTPPSKAQAAREERENARALLRKIFPRDAAVTVVLVHVSRSRMSRRFLVLAGEGDRIGDVSHLVLRAGVGTCPRNGAPGVVVPGAGMDMAFSLVYDLAGALYGDGYALRHNTIAGV